MQQERDKKKTFDVRVVIDPLFHLTKYVCTFDVSVALKMNQVKIMSQFDTIVTKKFSPMTDNKWPQNSDLNFSEI